MEHSLTPAFHRVVDIYLRKSPTRINLSSRAVLPGAANQHARTRKNHGDRGTENQKAVHTRGTMENELEEEAE